MINILCESRQELTYVTWAISAAHQNHDIPYPDSHGIKYRASVFNDTDAHFEGVIPNIPRWNTMISKAKMPDIRPPAPPPKRVVKTPGFWTGFKNMFDWRINW